MSALLKMQDIGLTYQSVEGETQAVKGLNLTIERGTFTALVGPSGCGKTTVLSLVAGLIKPTSGKIFIGSDNQNSPSDSVGYMLQRYQLFPWRNIFDNVCIGLEIKKIKTSENIDYAKNLLEKYGLGEFSKRYPDELSGGMKQRVALIRTLVLRPQLLLLDEPFSALDYQTRLKVCDDVYSIIRSEKKTALLVTHDISEAVALADKVVVLSKRPSSVKAEFSIEFPSSVTTPLLRREHPIFSTYFDKIYRITGEN
jgi:NitT/TauT family transport system ATP-binding protein